MAEIPGMTGELNVPGTGGAFDDLIEDIGDSRRRWDGKGKPPSREAAAAWLARVTTMSLSEAKAYIGKRGTLTDIGTKARSRQAEFKRKGGYIDERGVPREKSGKATGQAKREQERLDAAKRNPAQEIADEMGLDDAQADELESLLNSEIGASAGEDSRGAPLWRYEGDPEQLAEITVQDQSKNRFGIARSERASGMPGHTERRTGARYFEQHTLEPLKWSPEQRADLQRVLNQIGLYGKDAKIRLGSWTAKDQAVYAELLASANEEGLTWVEMLARWKRTPPEDLLAEINGDEGANKRAPLVVQHTNPIDVQETAREISRGLIGREDRGFIEGTPRKYNEVETATQTAAYNASDPDGSGGTVMDAPSVSAYASDQLRRSKPAEVDSYATLGAFNEVLRELGLAG